MTEEDARDLKAVAGGPRIARALDYPPSFAGSAGDRSVASRSGIGDAMAQLPRQAGRSNGLRGGRIRSVGSRAIGAAHAAETTELHGRRGGTRASGATQQAGLGEVVLYGHSDGGSIALLFAAAFPQRALAVVSEAAHVFSEVNSASGFDEVLTAFESGDLHQRLVRHHGDNLDAMFRGWADIW